MELRTVAGSKDIASRGPATPERGCQCVYGPKVGCRAGLIPSGTPGCWSRRCQSTCGGGDAQRTRAVTARRARSHGNRDTTRVADSRAPPLGGAGAPIPKLDGLDVRRAELPCASLPLSSERVLVVLLQDLLLHSAWGKGAVLLT